MAVLARGKTFTSTEEVTNSKLHQLVDSATISGIVNADVDAAAAIAASKLNLTTVAQAMTISQLITMSGASINFAKGANIASATTTDIGAATGIPVDVTGTTTITGLGTIQAGTTRIVRFTGILILTYNATSLILPGSANVTTQAGDVAVLVSLGSGNWYCASYTRRDGTPLASLTVSNQPLQSKSATSAAVDTSTTLLPVDATVPANSEGEEFSALDVAITPSNTNNILEIELVLYVSHSSGDMIGATVLQDTTVVCGGFCVGTVSFNESRIHIKFRKAAGTTSATTFHVRYGPHSTGTARTNSIDGSNNTFGGLLFSTLSVREVKA